MKRFKKGQIWAYVYEIFDIGRVDLFFVYDVKRDIVILEGLDYDHKGKFRLYGYPKSFYKNLIYIG